MKALLSTAVACFLFGCGGDQEANLRSLPERAAQAMRAGDWGAVADLAAPEFTAHGLSWAQCQQVLRRRLGREQPYVARVEVGDAVVEEERTLTVVGLWCPDGVNSTSVRRLRPFRATVRVRPDGDDWVATRVTLDR